MRWLDANAGATIAADDRGLAYGDGVFETMRIVDDALPLLERHLARLGRSLARLDFPPLTSAALRTGLARHVSAYPGHDWLKLIVTRGSGARGYAYSGHAQPVAVTASGTLTPIKPSGWSLGFSDEPVTGSRRLTGIKHLSRLGEVLAAASVEARVFDEQLRLDQNGRVVCGIMSNVFVVRDGALATPRMVAGGVAGVMRDWLISACPVSQRVLTVEDLMLADEVFMTNALRGVVSVSRIFGQPLPAGTPVADAVRRDLADIGYWL